MRRPSDSRGTPRPVLARTISPVFSIDSSTPSILPASPATSPCCVRPEQMPKRTDIKSVLIIGAGPIVIGQACEFDYSGAQACKALREEGYRVILVNSNPATIMTDPN